MEGAGADTEPRAEGGVHVMSVNRDVMRTDGGRETGNEKRGTIEGAGNEGTGKWKWKWCERDEKRRCVHDDESVCKNDE